MTENVDLETLDDSERVALLFWLTGYLRDSAEFQAALARGIESQMRVREYRARNAR